MHYNEVYNNKTNYVRFFCDFDVIPCFQTTYNINHTYPLSKCKQKLNMWIGL